MIRDEGYLLLLAIVLAAAVSIAPFPPAWVQWVLLMLAIAAGLLVVLHRQGVL